MIDLFVFDLRVDNWMIDLFVFDLRVDI